MAKELPYFRFTASEWLNDDISLESYEIKGLFIDVCAYYWSQDCECTLSKLEKRFSNAKVLLKQLIDCDIIKHENRHDKIKIEFLIKQYDLLSEKRKLRQEAGSKGGNAKAKRKQDDSYKDNNKDNNKDKDASLKKKTKKVSTELNDEHQKYLSWFNKVTNRDIRTLNKTDINNFNQLKELEYTGEDHLLALQMLLKNDWAKENGAITISHFLRKNNFERYLQKAKNEGTEDCPYTPEQLRVANMYLESGGTPDWFDKKWINKLPSYGTRRN